MPRAILDIQDGDVFGKLTIIGRVFSEKWKMSVYECKCECGVVVLKKRYHLKSRLAKSCGCSRDENKRVVHGDARKKEGKRPSEYNSYHSMLQRCYNPNESKYKHYGGRGITVCDRWRESYQNFLEDMGRKPKGYVIDRVDVDGNYEPSNCIWQPKSDMPANRRDSRYFEYNGEVIQLHKLMKMGFGRKRILKHFKEVHR